MSQLAVFLRHAKRNHAKELDLSKRQLSVIPKQVFTMRNIQSLDLSVNKIVSIDHFIADLYRLKTLNLQNNCLVDLPQQLVSCPQLRKLLLKGNPLDKQFEVLLEAKNQETPQLTECLQICFEPEDSRNSKAPSWLTEGGESKEMKKKGEISDINWDQSIFKVQSKISSNSIPDVVRRQNPKLMKNISISLKTNQKPQVEAKNGILQPKFESIEIYEQISMGGFSTIHRGQYEGLQVAVKKVFNPNISEELMSQFNNQLQMLAKYRHPRIVYMLAAVTVPPTLCMVMEYVKGGTLYEILHKKRINLSEKQKKNIVQQLIGVFSYLHNHGIVHRDIKSHNILMTENLEVKVCDFGLARHRSELNSGPMQFCGTPTYMAQQLFLKKGYDESVDIFALGTLFYEVYAGEVPYSGFDPIDIKTKLLQNSDLPSKLTVKQSIMEIINKCRNQNPSFRPNFKDLKNFNEW